jgi:SNF2 family DNA or RNA helicase
MGGYEVGGRTIFVDGRYETIGGRPQQILGYKNLDELTAMIDTVTYKKRKSEVASLPPKTYEIRFVTLTARSKKAYNDAVRDIKVQIGDHNITLEMAITKAVKLRQITGGAVKDDEGNVVHVGTEKLDEVMAAMEQVGRAQVLVWCQFRHEAAMLHEAMLAKGIKAEIYQGGVKSAVRDVMVQNFESGHLQVLIMQNDAGYRAVTLNATEYAFIYSNPEKLDIRTQLEDRSNRIGGKNVTYIDFVVPGSIDEVLIDSNKFKGTVANYVMWGEGENKTYNVRSRVLRVLK